MKNIGPIIIMLLFVEWSPGLTTSFCDHVDSRFKPRSNDLQMDRFQWNDLQMNSFDELTHVF